MRPFHFYAASGAIAVAAALLVALAPHYYLLGVLVGALGVLAVACVAGGVARHYLEAQTADLQDQMSALLEGGDLSALMGGLGGFGPLGQADTESTPVSPVAPVALEQAQRVLADEDRPIFRTGKVAKPEV